MKKSIKWIFRALIICIILVVVSFIYWRWGFSMPDNLSINETFTAGDFEFVIENAVNIPAGLIHSYVDIPAKDSHVLRGNVIDLTMNVTNKSDQSLILNDELNFAIDQINDPKLLQFLHLHFYENSQMPVIYNPKAPEENIVPDIYTKLEAKETKKLHFIFFYFETDNNEYNFQIGDWSGNTFVNRQIEVSKIKPCDKIQTENLSVKPLGIYQNETYYGLTLHIQNNTNERQSFHDMLEVVAVKDMIWDYMILETIISGNKEANISEFYLEPNQEYIVNLVGSDFIGDGEFNIRTSDRYYSFLLD